MKLLKREDLPARQVMLTIAVEPAAWQQALEACYRQVKEQYPVEGDADRPALEKAYGSDFLYQEAVNATFPAALVEAINREELLLAGSPTLSVETIGPEGYTFSALIDLYPEVTLGPYKGLHAPWNEALGEEARDAFGDALMQQVVDNMRVEIPDAMVEGQLNGILQSLNAQLQSQHIEPEQYLAAAGITQEELRAQARAQARAAARYELALNAIAQAEDILISEEELEGKYAQLAGLYGAAAEQLKAQYPAAQLRRDMRLAKARALVFESGIRD